MNWNKHLELEGKHAILSPSSYHWIDIDISSSDAMNVIFQRYKASYATSVGTCLHEYAEKRIRHNLRMNRYGKNDVLMYLYDRYIPESVIDLDSKYDNLMAYVNDAIGFRMDPEVVLRYSDNCFGTADTIYFRKNELRIHDYKSGKTQASIKQPLIYSALFCLEYGLKPRDISTQLRIYQMNDVVEYSPEPEEIHHAMEQIVSLDKMITKWKAGDGLA